MTLLTQNQVVRPSLAADETLDWQDRLAAHRRDVDLFGRLFSNWTCGRRQHTQSAHLSLDAIDAQLARLEQAV